MAKLTTIFAATLISFAQCAVLNNEDGVLRRTARSPCYTCGQKSEFPPPPPPFPHPPPPPVLQTENWSGLARSADGLQNAVFSGAAAAAKQGAQTSGEAFSLASSTVNGGVGAGLSSDQSSGYGGATGGVGGSIGIHHEVSSGLNDGQISNDGHGHGGYSARSYKESHSYHTGNGKSIANGGSQQEYSNGAGFGSQSEQNSGLNGGTANHGYGHGISVEHNNKYHGYHHSEIQQVQPGGNGKYYGESQLSNNEGRFDSASQPEQGIGNTRGADYQGFGGQHSAAGSSNNNFGRYHSSETQQVQSGIGVGTGTGYSSYGSASRDTAGENSYSHRLSGGQHPAGRYLADAQLNQNGYGSSSSSQSEKFGRHINEPSHGGLEGQYPNGKGSFGDQQSSQGLSYGRAHGEEAVGQLQSGGYGSSNLEELKKAGHTELQSTGQAQYAQGGASGLQGGVSGSLTGDAQSALSGALNLASQGVQAAHQTAAGCATCGKSSYALSNAKSHSGAAVALSIGG